MSASSSSSANALLTYSWPTRGYAQFWVGGTVSAADGSFEPARTGQLEYGVGYAGEMTATWPGRLLLFSWMRGVSDGAAYVGAQSLPREMGLLEDGTATVRVAEELEKLIVASSTKTANLTATPAAPAAPFAAEAKAAVPQQARLRLHVTAAGASLPANVGISLQQGAAVLQLVVSVKQGSACMSMGPRQGCAPIPGPSTTTTAPTTTGAASGAWMLETEAEVWLDNGLVEIIAGKGTAVLSAFYPRLFSPGVGLNGSAWAENNASATFNLDYSAVQSATFTTDDE